MHGCEETVPLQEPECLINACGCNIFQASFRPEKLFSQRYAREMNLSNSSKNGDVLMWCKLIGPTTALAEGEHAEGRTN